MAKSKKAPKYLVVLVEYERGWGSRAFAATGFETFAEAQKYAAEENASESRVGSVTVPDYYINAYVYDCKDLTPNEMEDYKKLM